MIKSANQTTKTSSKNFLLYGYIQPLINFIAYDGTLQGEIFRKNSIYTIANSDINRAVGQINYGLVLQMNVIYFEYSGTGITQEVKTLGPASWGGFKIGFRL